MGIYIITVEIEVEAATSAQAIDELEELLAAEMFTVEKLGPVRVAEGV